MCTSCKLSAPVSGEHLNIPIITKPPELLSNRNILKTGGKISFISVCLKLSNTSKHYSLRYSFLDFISTETFCLKTYFKSLIPCISNYYFKRQSFFPQKLKKFIPQMELTSSSKFPRINLMGFLCIIFNFLLTWKQPEDFCPSCISSSGLLLKSKQHSISKNRKRENSTP